MRQTFAPSKGRKLCKDSIKKAAGDVIKAASKRAAVYRSGSRQGLEPLQPMTFMAAVDLLAWVVKNSTSRLQQEGACGKAVLEKLVSSISGRGSRDRGANELIGERQAIR
jgi:hypothetical protein